MNTPLNMLAVLQAMPINSIETEYLAFLDGLHPPKLPKGSSSSICFLMPPAGQIEPYINPIEALATLYIHCGTPIAEAGAKALAETSTLLSAMPPSQQVPLYQFSDAQNVRPCVPVRAFLAHLRRQGGWPTRLLDWIENALQTTMTNPVMQIGRHETLRLSELPVLPTPGGMIEFFVGLPSDLCIPFQDENYPTTGEWDHSPFYRWRDAIRPVAASLEQALGQWVYHFAAVDNEVDDDYCHRFLALHCWCSLLPESTLVQHLVKVSGAKDVEHLKAALIDPANYTHPFGKDVYAFEMDPVRLRFHWREEGHGHRVGIAFAGDNAIPLATKIASEQWDCLIHFLMPKEPSRCRDNLFPQIKDCTFVYLEQEPFEFLAGIDELFVIGDENSAGKTSTDLHLSPYMEALLWRAIQLGIPVHYHWPSGMQMSNPQDVIKKGAIPAKCAAKDVARNAQPLPDVIRIWPEFYSSGLWTGGETLQMYDWVDVNVPFALMRRLHVWIQEYNDIAHPDEKDVPDSRWDAFEQEQIEIGCALQLHWGDAVRVEIQKGDAWMPVNASPVYAALAKSDVESDTTYLQRFIDGTTDFFAADILERLEPMFTKYENNTSMMALLNRAADAYSDAAVKAALAALAEDAPQ